MAITAIESSLPSPNIPYETLHYPVLVLYLTIRLKLVKIRQHLFPDMQLPTEIYDLVGL